MFANQPVFGDSKENVKNVIAEKTSLHSSLKGFKSRSLKSFKDSTNVVQNKNCISKMNAGSFNLLFEEKENSKPKVKVPDIKVETHTEEDSWSDIEEMHIYVEPDDDYEDILPKCERIQKQDVDALFCCNLFSLAECTEPIVHKLPSPLKESENLCVPELLLLVPDMKESLLFNDTELDFLPVPTDFPFLE